MSTNKVTTQIDIFIRLRHGFIPTVDISRANERSEYLDVENGARGEWTCWT